MPDDKTQQEPQPETPRQPETEPANPNKSPEPKRQDEGQQTG